MFKIDAFGTELKEKNVNKDNYKDLLYILGFKEVPKTYEDFLSSTYGDIKNPEKYELKESFVHGYLFWAIQTLSKYFAGAELKDLDKFLSTIPYGSMFDEEVQSYMISIMNEIDHGAISFLGATDVRSKFVVDIANMIRARFEEHEQELEDQKVEPMPKETSVHETTETIEAEAPKAAETTEENQKAVAVGQTDKASQEPNDVIDVTDFIIIPQDEGVAKARKMMYVSKPAAMIPYAKGNDNTKGAEVIVSAKVRKSEIKAKEVIQLPEAKAKKVEKKVKQSKPVVDVAKQQAVAQKSDQHKNNKNSKKRFEKKPRNFKKVVESKVENAEAKKAIAKALEGSYEKVKQPVAVAPKQEKKAEQKPIVVAKPVVKPVPKKTESKKDEFVVTSLSDDDWVTQWFEMSSFPEIVSQKIRNDMIKHVKKVLIRFMKVTDPKEPLAVYSPGMDTKFIFDGIMNKNNAIIYKMRNAKLRIYMQLDQDGHSTFFNLEWIKEQVKSA